MTSFHEGQEVEVLLACAAAPLGAWRKGKIVAIRGTHLWPGYAYEVEFHDRTFSVVDAEHIREVSP